jgi:hypothetical protein
MMILFDNKYDLEYRMGIFYYNNYIIKKLFIKRNIGFEIIEDILSIEIILNISIILNMIY